MLCSSGLTPSCWGWERRLAQTDPCLTGAGYLVAYEDPSMGLYRFTMLAFPIASPQCYGPATLFPLNGGENESQGKQEALAKKVPDPDLYRPTKAALLH